MCQMDGQNHDSLYHASIADRVVKTIKTGPNWLDYGIDIVHLSHRFIVHSDSYTCLGD